MRLRRMSKHGNALYDKYLAHRREFVAERDNIIKQFKAEMEKSEMMDLEYWKFRGRVPG